MNFIGYYLAKIGLIGRSRLIDFNPVFLIGCGRSGTTILGRTLGKHPSIRYLNERRNIWHKAYPFLDIWNGNREAAVYLDGARTDERRNKVLIKSFHLAQAKNSSELLLEKLPINNFRLDFINTIFPNCKFIYLHRNGLEVAESIKKLSEQGKWFGTNNMKWKLLQRLAKEKLNLDTGNYSYFEQGLLEWRLSMEFSESFFSNIEQDRYFSLSYNTLLDNPSFQISKIYEFLGLKYDDEMVDQYVEGMNRRSLIQDSANDKMMEIGGDLLQSSIDNRLRHTFRNP